MRQSHWMTFLGCCAGLLAAGSRLAQAEVDGTTLAADASRIDADITQLQQDQQKLQTLIPPDKLAVAAAQKQFDQDAAPLLAHLKDHQSQVDALLKADRDAIKLTRDQAEASIHALEARAEEDRKRAARDKSAAAQVAQDDGQIKSARQKLKDDLKPLEEKLKSDNETGEQSLADERQAMKITLQPDTDALHKAQQQLTTDLLWQSKVDADQAAMKADQQKLDTDKQAAGQ